MIGLLNRITSFFIGFGYLFLSLDTSFLALVFVLPPDAAIRPPSETLLPPTLAIDLRPLTPCFYLEVHG